MSGFPVTCSNCGHRLQNENETPCPNCGDTRRTVHMEARGQTISSARVGMTIHRLQTEVKKNWPLIATLIVCDLLSVFPAYFLNGWASVAVTVFFILLSTVLGYYAITRVITITKETR
jgi:predicted RNA-binding Zn-ribbon protein involved in translation (DUF1610 family)